MSLPGVTSNGGVTPHTTSQNYTSRAKMRQPARKPPRSGQKRWGLGHRKPRRRGIQLSLFAEDWRGRRPSPNSLDSTARSDAEESPGSVLAQATCSFCAGATRAKLCKCCQGQTPQNFDRVLAAACLYRDMLICIRLCQNPRSTSMQACR